MLSRQLKISGVSSLFRLRKCNSAISKFVPTRCTCFAESSVIRRANIDNHIRFNSNIVGTENNVITTKPKQPFKRMSSDELLERLIAGLSTDIHQKHRVYKNSLLRVIHKVKEMNFSTKKQGLLLIRCCADLLPDETPAGRMELLEQIWEAIKPHTTFDVDHYNELLRVYIANNKTVVPQKFFTMMGTVKPDLNTYELIIRALSEAGELDQAMEVLANMKEQRYPATENILNSLVLCQGMAGAVKNIEEVITMMRSLKIELTADTYVALIRALAANKKQENALEEFRKAHRNNIVFDERHIMEIVKTLANVGMEQLVPEVLKYLPEESLKSPSISAYMQSVATQLVFQNHPLVALEIYKCLSIPSFGPKDDIALHGRSLVRDCVRAFIPSSVIFHITQELMSSGRNPIAIQNAAEAALQFGRVPLALDMLSNMKQLSLPLRSHYFWPILLNSSKSYGEKGIMNTIRTMLSMEVTPDYDTIMYYVLPYVSFTSPQNLMKKFQETGLSVSLVLTPMMVTLLQTGQVRSASEICELFKGKVDAEKILKPLYKGYFLSMDQKSTIHILEDLCKKAVQKKDWTGRFLCLLIKDRKRKDDITDFLKFAQAMKGTQLKISTTAADFCLSYLPNNLGEDKIKMIKEMLLQIIDETLVDDGDMFGQELPHPKHMNEEALRAHLVELEAKGMNTRGVLRKLLQEYCRAGNLVAAKETLEKCQKEGVFLSAGMKAAVFDMHVKLGELELAELTLAELESTAPNFQLDEYKILDFATLMVFKNKIEKAKDFLTEQSRKRQIKGDSSSSMNCFRLLDMTATHGTQQDTRQMFDLLTSLRYCRPNNSLLGPLIRPYINKKNLTEATNEFVRIANKYNKTPLKHELLCQILESMNDGMSEEKFVMNEKCNSSFNKLVQTILSVTKKVHGTGDVQLTLVAALAEVGYKKTLRKVFLDPTMKFHPDALMRRCERFADEKKAAALENIAECARDIRNVDTTAIYDLAMDVYQRDDDIDKALKLWNKMQENEITPSQKFLRNLVSMATTCNRPIPSEVYGLLDKDQVQAKTL